MSDVRENLYYTVEHEWISVDGIVATIGITDFAQESLGDLVFVELPAVGDTIDLAEQVAVVESVKAASEIYSPLSGEIVEINEELEDAPDAINSHPYDDGWLVKIELSDKAEIEELMDKAAYEDYIEGLV